MTSDDYHEHSNELDKIVDSYHEHLANKYNSMEETLLKELHNKSELIKQDIARLTILTSDEAVDELILAKKQEKQAQRAQLEKMWRGLTNSLKKMEEEEKQIIDQNKEYEFDARSIRDKIAQLHSENEHLSGVVTQLRKNQASDAFLTQHRNQKSNTCLFGANSTHHKSRGRKDTGKNHQCAKMKVQARVAHRISSEGILSELLQKDSIKRQIFYILHNDKPKPIR